MAGQELETSLTAKQGLLAVALGICTMLAIFIVAWAQESEPPIYRPLVQDIKLVDSVKIADVLEQNNIQYITDIKAHMIFVAQADNVRARIALARVGIEIDYPTNIPVRELAKVCADALPQIEPPTEIPLWEQRWAMRALKLVMGGLIMVVLILAVVRPMLKELIYPNDKDVG